MDIMLSFEPLNFTELDKLLDYTRSEFNLWLKNQLAVLFLPNYGKDPWKNKRNGRLPASKKGI